MKNIYLISHPQVIIDKNKLIENWELSPEGLLAIDRLMRKNFWTSINHIYTSNEAKAIPGALIVSEKLKNL